MAHKVTPMNPMFALGRTVSANGIVLNEWYAIDDDGGSMWVIDQKRALLFMSIHSADLLQKAEGGDIIAITNDTTYEDFRK